MPDTATTTRYTRTAAPGVTEVHAAGCSKSAALAAGKSADRARCTCSPKYRARRSAGARGSSVRRTKTLPSLAAALAYLGELDDRVAGGDDLTVPDDPATPTTASALTLRDAATRFVHRMATGAATGRGGRPYSTATADNYTRALQQHVLPAVLPDGRVLGDMRPADVSTRTLAALSDLVVQRVRDLGRGEGATAARKAALAAKDTTMGNGNARIAVSALRRLLADLYAQDLLEAVPPLPPSMPSPPKPRARRLTFTERDAVLAAAADDDQRQGVSLMRPFLTLAFDTGARRGELLGLRWGAGGLDLGHNGSPRMTVSRDTTKGDRGERTVGLSAGCTKALREHMLASGGRDGDLVFPVKPDTLRKGMDRVGEAAGVTPLNTHAVRHAVASWAMEATGDATAVSARLGHDARTLMAHYSHADNERIASTPLPLPEAASE